MRDVELWEAVALSLNLEPDKLPVYLGAFERFGDDPFRICPQTFLDRLQVANSNCGISLGFKPVHKLKARCLVDLPAFGAWTVKLNIPNIPPAFAAMAETATTVPVVMPAQTAATPVPAVAVGASDDVEPKSNLPWWQVAYDIQDMVQNIGAKLYSEQKRASNAAIAKEIEKRINDIERNKGRSRKAPNHDTIRGLLTGWVWRPE